MGPRRPLPAEEQHRCETEGGADGHPVAGGGLIVLLRDLVAQLRTRKRWRVAERRQACGEKAIRCARRGEKRSGIHPSLSFQEQTHQHDARSCQASAADKSWRRLRDEEGALDLQPLDPCSDVRS
jgi:hypothetical protein